MGRKNKYESHVQPYLNDIKKWIEKSTEEQIARKLGVSQSSFELYKTQHEELKEVLKAGRQQLVEELHGKLKRKAMGYEYTEKKETIKNEDGHITTVTEIYTKYAHPDTAAIHLLLKNYDETWHNDDKATLDIKREQLEVAKKKAEAAEW